MYSHLLHHMMNDSLNTGSKTWPHLRFYILNIWMLFFVVYWPSSHALHFCESTVQ
jgi:hypothetical protein